MAETLRVAMIGLGTFGRRTLEALRNDPQAELVGVADRDGRLVEQAVGDIPAEGFTDTRQMILQTKPEVVFLATPPMGAPDLLEFCAKHGISVWKEAPLGRSLGEAADFVRRFEQAGLKFAVGTQRHFFDTYAHAFKELSRIGDIFLARSHYLFNWGPGLQWRADRQAAGGGALLELGYHMIDLLVWMLGLPEEVYGVTARGRRSPEMAELGDTPHDTDDSASATLRYKGEAMVTMATSRISGPVSEELAVHGRRGSITVDGDSCILRSANGDVLDHVQAKSSPQDVFNRQVSSFLQAVAGKADKYECSAAANLLTHAVIDAIYLSSQTCQPENPLRQLQINGLTTVDCYKYSE